MLRLCGNTVLCLSCCQPHSWAQLVAAKRWGFCVARPFHLLSQAMKAAGASKSMKVMKSKAVRTLPKSGIAAQVAESTGLKKSEVTQVLTNLADIGAAEVKKTGGC